MIDFDEVIQEVKQRGAVQDEAGARAAVEGALDALSRPLSSRDRALIAGRLPGALAAIVRRPSPSSPLDPAGLQERLAAQEKISLGLAVEHVQVACAVLARFLDGEARTVIARRLSPQWTALFTAGVRQLSPDVVPGGTVPGHGHTLATGRPGSARPLSEADGRERE